MTGRKPVLIMIYLCLAMLDCCQAVASGTDGEGLSSRQRGAETFVNLCMLCHDMKYIEYQDLMQLGLTEKKLDALRRGRSLKSSLHSDMTPDAANKMFGMAIPDLSLMAIAREKGSEHIYRLLTTYYEKPDGTVDNHEFPQVRMPDVLGYATETDQQSRAALEAQARDVAAFLGWAAEPNAKYRKRLGVFVLTYLFVLTVLLYLVKNKVWRRLD